MKLFFSSLILSCFFFFSFKSHDERTSVRSELRSAIVYRTGATLTHKAVANLPAGDNELVIEGLSSYLDINSIQVNCPAAVTILGTEFSNNYLTPENVSPAVKSLKDSLEKITASITKINTLINTANELSELLRMNRDVKGAQAGLSVAELAKLMTYYEVKANEIKTNLADYNAKKIKLETLSAKLNSQIEEEQKKNTVSGGRLTLQLSVAIGGPQEFTVSYITQNAGWVPYYDIKADNIKSPLKFIYKAKVSQTTGIDWKKVKLTLSTSAPKQYGNAPVPKTWFLSYANPVFIMDKELEKSKDVSVLHGKAAGLEVVNAAYGYNKSVTLRGLRSVTEGNHSIVVVNGIKTSADFLNTVDPKSVAKIDILKGNEAVTLYGSEAAEGAIIVTLKDGLEDYITVSESELDVSYEIDLPYDVPASGKQQIAVLKETSVPASYKYYSAPRLDKSAYLLAEVTDWQKLNLLPGEANIIFEGTYIGKSVIDPANTNDTLNLTLGTDKRVVITREKLKDYSSVKFLGNNRLQTVTYEITVRNNKKDAISMLLKDQYPKSTDKEIEVNLTDASGGNVNAETGIISWPVNLAAGETKKIRLTYSVKYPKEKYINPN